MTRNFIRLSGPCIKPPRLVFLSDAHGRIILANCHTRHIDGKMEIYPAPDCGYLSIYLPVCLDNVRRLLREDERKNDRLFDEALEALRQLAIGQDYVGRKYYPSEAMTCR